MRESPGRCAPGLSRSIWLRSSAGLGAGTGPGAGIAPLDGAPLVLAHAAPHASVLAGLESPAQTVGRDGATTADGLRLGDLQQSGTTVPHGEEQLRVLVSAGRAVAPVHRYVLLACARRPQRRAVSVSAVVLVNTFTKVRDVKR